MNPWTKQLDTLKHQVQEEFGQLDTEQLYWKPHASTWSIAENLHHLITVNESYYPVLDALERGMYKPPFITRIGFLVSFFGKLILQSVQPDRKRKMKTFPIWEPGSVKKDLNILAVFKKHLEQLNEKIEAAQHLVDEGKIIASPANKNIVYKLATAFDIIITHMFRHLEQAKEVSRTISSTGKNQHQV